MTHRWPPARILQGLLLAMVVALSGCASVPSTAPHDPYESTNRAVARFNDDVDQAVLKPMAQTWRNVVPEPARDGVDNFFHNLSDLWSALNHVLQGRLAQGATNVVRFGVNSVLGLFGVFDVASNMGFARADTDVGETFATWGVAPGPYVVLPFLGPSTVRGTTGQLLQWRSYRPLQNVRDTPWAAALSSLITRATGSPKSFTACCSFSRRRTIDSHAPRLTADTCGATSGNSRYPTRCPGQANKNR